MAISINTNNAAFDAARNLQLTSQDFITAVQRLSSGLRINSAADDPAGLAVSQRLTSGINGFDQAVRNLQDGVSMIQQATAGLDETQTVLERMNTLAVQASNATYTTSDRQSIQQEVLGLLSEINRVANQTEYNNQLLLNGSAGGATISGGGPDITNIQVQAGVTPSGTTLSINGAASTNGLASTIVASAAGSATFVGAAGNGGVAPSLTITGPTGSSATFTSTAGELVSDFIDQVNNSGIDVTASLNGSGALVLTSNDVGLNNGSNSSGAQNITVSGPTNAVDFGTGGGADLSIAGLTVTTGAAGSQAGQNAVLAYSVDGGATQTTTLQGINSNEFSGSGAATGITFQLTNPGAIQSSTNSDTITVTQNSPLKIHVGASSGSVISFGIDAQTTANLGLDNIDMSTQTGAESAITTVQAAIDQVSTAQANLGAIQNRLTDAQDLASTNETNLISAKSNVVDANIPQETIRFTTDQILMQATTAVLAQANQTPAGLLSLLSTTAVGH